MSNQEGARPAPGAPKKPGAVSQPASRPLHRDADGCYPVAADKVVIGGWANYNNNNANGDQGGPRHGDNADSHVNTPEGKPSV